MSNCEELVTDDQEKESIANYEKYALCAVLPSPELISFGSNPGSDTTKTKKDFNDVVHWLKENKLKNVGFFEYHDQPLEKSNFKSIITSAFQLAYDPIRNTRSLNLSELVFWYYAGHGVSPASAAGELSVYSAIPRLGNVNTTTPEKLKGGELCLHWAGFCNLKGLVNPFIDAVGTGKSNKHLVVVLDSCHSGMLANDLESLKDKLKNGCTVTVQASCNSKENAIGGLFTQTFLFFNKHKQVLKTLKAEWQKMDDSIKQTYQNILVPSPVLTTIGETNPTNPDGPTNSDGLTIDITVQNLEVTLFCDGDFFKFCYDTISKNLKLHKERVMTPQYAKTFLEEQNFTVIDFKLITMLGQGAYQGCLLGLFLLEDHNDPSKAVCAHVHFAKGDTSRVGRINLVHHLKSHGNGVLEFENEDEGGLRRNRHKIPVAAVPQQQNASGKNPSHWFYWNWNDNPKDFDTCIQQNNLPITDLEKINNVKCAMQLVKTCHDFVEQSSPGHWNDVARWNMPNSYKNKFRAGEDTWMTEYLRRVREEYHLPKI